MGISNRFPKLEEISRVYAVIVMIIYGWTILWFFWKLPSWLFFLNTGEILTTLAYLLATNLLESLAVLLAPLLLSLILPKKWFYDLFVVRGTALALLGLTYAIYLANQFQTKEDYPSLSLKLWTVALAVGLILLGAFFAGRISMVRKFIEFFSDQATIFLYASIPLSLLSLLVVLGRAIF